MSRRILSLIAGVFALVLLAPPPALAWSELAHRAVADLAYERLTPETRNAINQIITQASAVPKVQEPGCMIRTLADAAAFPHCVDELGVRRFNNLEKLSYDAIPICGQVDKTNYCKNGQCASEAVRAAINILRNPAALPQERLLALAQVSNFLAALHQPLDAADNKDARGTRIRVSLPGSGKAKLNLHDVWDDQLVATAVGSEEVGVPYLAALALDNGGGWERGDLDAWGDETHRLATAFVYPRLPEPPMCGKTPNGVQALDRAYLSAAVPVVRQQLAKAGVRLAVVLNDALGRR